jgi:hypothetical protein
MDEWKFSPDAIVKCPDHEDSAADVGMLLDCAIDHEGVVLNMTLHAVEMARQAERILDDYNKLHRLSLRTLSSQADVRRAR